MKIVLVAAIGDNLVIGRDGQLPWRLKSDLQHFRKVTLNRPVVMGRKTFESLGKPLPDRLNVILTRHPILVRKAHPEIFGQSTLGTRARGLRKAYQFHLPKFGRKTEIRLQRHWLKLDPAEFSRDVFICGGAQIYEQALPLCSDLYLTLVKRECAGDAFFPPFEDRFELAAELRDTPEFKILHYRNRKLAGA